MDIKPIRTKMYYEDVLKEIDKLFSASPGTSKGDDICTHVISKLKEKK